MIQLARMIPQLRTTNMAAAVEFYTQVKTSYTWA